MKNMDENKSISAAVKLEKKEDQEETKPFPQFYSQFGKMSLTQNLQVIPLWFFKLCCFHG